MHGRRPPSALAFACATALALSLTATARAAPDYAAENVGWNGLSELLAEAERQGIEMVVRPTVDLGDLTPEDALLLVYPTSALPSASLVAFLREGGRVAIADDFGSGDQLLHRFGIERAPATPGESSLLRGNPALMVALPRAHHPLTEGVDLVVTNHPRVLRHPELQPLFSFDHRPDALVLSGSVGAGRLVAVGDPSVLINNMMAVQGNRRFAAALLRFLSDAPGGVVYLVGPDVRWIGRYGDVSPEAPFERLEAFIGRIARVHLPGPGLTVAALLLCGIFATFAYGALAFRGPYTARAMLPPVSRMGGFTNSLRFYLDTSKDLLLPTLLYKHELEAALRARLALTENATMRQVIHALGQAGLRGAQLAEAEALLGALSRLDGAQQTGSGSEVRVSARRFRQLTRRGRALLALVPARNGGTEA